MLHALQTYRRAASGGVMTAIQIVLTQRPLACKLPHRSMAAHSPAIWMAAARVPLLLLNRWAGTLRQLLPSLCPCCINRCPHETPFSCISAPVVTGSAPVVTASVLKPGETATMT